MSIAPPSDIVFDVAQAADPQRLQEAQAKLARMSAGAGSDFPAMLGSQPPVPTVRAPLYPSAPVVTTKPISPYQKFEAVLLQNLVDNILPRGEGLFGDAASSDVNRSMLAEQLALQIARTNRVGIAKMLEKAHGSSGLPQSGPQPVSFGPTPCRRGATGPDPDGDAATQGVMRWPGPRLPHRNEPPSPTLRRPNPPRPCTARRGRRWRASGPSSTGSSR